MKDQRPWLWAALALAIICGAIWQYFPLADALDRLDKIPKQGLGFRSAEVPLTPDEAGILKQANVVRRSYNLPEYSLLVTIIDGTRDRHAVHDPFYCIRGSGWKILQANSLRVPGGEAKWLRVSKEGREAEALIWFSDGQVRHPSAKKYWFQTTLRRLTLGRSGAEPVLVQVLATQPGVVNWQNLVVDFPILFQF